MKNARLALLLLTILPFMALAQTPPDDVEPPAPPEQQSTSEDVNARRLVIIREYSPGKPADTTQPKAEEPAPAAPVEQELLPAPKPTDEEHSKEEEKKHESHRESEEEEEHHFEEEECPDRYWVSASYLLWWIKAVDLPPLVTTGPTSAARPGALDGRFTSIRFGTPDIEPQERHGAHFFMGYWFDPEHRYSMELGGFFLSYRNISFIQNSTGSPVLARPLFDVINDQQTASLITYPGLATGGIHIAAGTSMHGVESNFIYAVRDDGLLGIDVLAGFRYVDLEEDLLIHETSNVLFPDPTIMPPPPSPPFAGSQIAVRDSFETKNDFYGGQIGLRARYHLRRMELKLGGKVAFGDSYQVVRIAGNTRIGNTPAATGGLLALPSNIGTYTRHEFAVVPEANAEFSFQLFKNFRVFAGYSFLYWSDIVRPGDQVDLTVNINQLPTNANPGVGGPERPRFEFRDTDFWVQGANFGVEFRW